MEGARIQQVKTALQIMLKSLPSKNTSLNIVSFGSYHRSLWPKSQTYSSETVQHASKHVDSFGADFGGTEIKSALEWSFQQKNDANLPVAVFVLTDGEAWDLDNVIKAVEDAAVKGKKDKTLVRTFVLGVGDDVSKPMCDGIARAGRGTAVYVTVSLTPSIRGRTLGSRILQDKEKPDAKLMGLLRAARGGLIEDLTVDWGVPEASEKKSSEDDDFEMITSDTATDASVKTAVASTPLSLFDDDSKPETTAPSLGPQKIAVNLPPPPRIQQAPESDKLPIPLYPGFRCSIFAIIRQTSAEAPFAGAVTIEGHVGGQPVALRIRVEPVQLASPANVILESNQTKLIHTLAARALVQVLEDQPKTPENDAKIERLGKRYSLATSVTSFLAIDEETKEKVDSSEATLPQEEEKEKGMQGRHTLQLRSNAAPAPMMGGGGYRGGRGGAPGSSPGGVLSSISSSLSSLRSRATPQSVSRSSATYGASPARYSPTSPSYTPTSPRYSPTSSGYSPPSPGYSPHYSHASSAFSLNSPAYSPSSAPSLSSYSAVPPPPRSGGPIPPPPPARRSMAAAAPEAAQSARGPASDLMSLDFEESYEGGHESLSLASKSSAPKSAMRYANSILDAEDDEDEALTAIEADRSVKKKRKGSGSATVGGFGSAAPLAAPAPAPVSSHSAYPISSSLERSAPPKGGRVSSTLTLETIARAQNFDGSFPHTTELLQLVTANNTVPALPSVLQGLSIGEAEKHTIWATILVLAALEKKFGGSEKESWEMMGEKATDFIEGVLNDASVLQQLKAEAVKHV